MSAKKRNPKTSVEVDLGNGIKYHVDTEEQWAEFSSEEFSGQLESVICPFFWAVQFNNNDLPLADKNKFYDDFQRPEAEHAREIAVRGLKHVNNWPLFRLLKDAMDWEKNRQSGHNAKHTEAAISDAAVIGAEFAELAAKKDYRAFRRMADMLQAGGIPPGDKSGEESLSGQIVREFCLHFVNHRTLPTKKQLREKLGLSTEKFETEPLRKAMKELGLSGLPQGRKS
jgi:hypothetical protein